MSVWVQVARGKIEERTAEDWVLKTPCQIKVLGLEEPGEVSGLLVGFEHVPSLVSLKHRPARQRTHCQYSDLSLYV